MIEDSESHWSSSIVCVPKKDGRTRMCVDFIQVNKIMPKDDFVFPNIDRVIHNMGKIKPK